jgi:hypothetical protein
VLSTANQPEVSLAPESSESLQRLFESELRFRRAFVAGKFPVRERQRCCLVVVHPAGGSFSVEAEAVYLKAEEPGAGVGLDLVGLDPDKLAGLESFVRQATEAPPVAEVSPAEVSPAEVSPEDNAGSPKVETGPRNIYERIRQLSLHERERVARHGLLSKRVALERTFGGSVWEGLLQNSSLTVPEVAQIAKKGTRPQPLVATIVANGGWLASGEVRRALLGNPRVGGVQLDRVLRATPKPELKQIAQMSPYRSQVRMAAKKLFSE